VHPRYLLGALNRTQYEKYKALNRERALACYKAMTSMMIDNSLVKIKDGPPYAAERDGHVLLNPIARATLDKGNNSYSFPKNLPREVDFDMSNVEAAAKALAANGSIGIGVDHGVHYSLKYCYLWLILSFRAHLSGSLMEPDICCTQLY
jgi:fatty acid synthase subunit alpha, fungi type